MAGKELKAGKKRGMYLAGNKQREKMAGTGKFFWREYAISPLG